VKFLPRCFSHKGGELLLGGTVTFNGILSLFQSTGDPVTGDATKRRVNLTSAIAATTPRQLTITNFPSIGPTQQPGALVTLEATVQNAGTAAAGAFDVEYFLSATTTWSTTDIFLGKVSVPGLGAGASTLASVNTQMPWRLKGLVYTVHAVVDRTNQVIEWDENDNSASTFLVGLTGACFTKLEYNDPLMTPNANAEVSATLGGTVHPILVSPCLDPAATIYLIAWGGAGTSPGVPLAPGVTLPLNPDMFTDIALAHANGPVLGGFIGLLEPDKTAQATFALPPLTGLPSGQTHFAVVYFGGPSGFQATSNPLGLLLTP
jgi:hypothetical protein